MVIPAPIFRQLIMIDPDFSLGKIKVYLDAPALTSCPGHLRDGNGLRGTGQVKLNLSFSRSQRSPDHQPRSRSGFPVPFLKDPQASELKLSRSFVPFTQTDALPLIVRNRRDKRRCGNGRRRFRRRLRILRFSSPPICQGDACPSFRT